MFRLAFILEDATGISGNIAQSNGWVLPVRRSTKNFLVILEVAKVLAALHTVEINKKIWAFMI